VTVLPARPKVTTTEVLRLHAATDGDRVGPLDLEVRGGEIVGIAGVEGNGQTELIELLVGVRPCTSGVVFLGKQDITRWSVARRLDAGLAHIAEDRHAAAVALDLSLPDNCLLGYQDSARYAPRRWRVSWAEVDRLAQDVVRRHRVRTPSLRARIRELSGGNQQKLVVGREISRDPKVIIAAQPTRGLDIGATAFVHRELLDLRARGCAVLLVSLELSEVLALSDRVVVMHSGKVAGEGRPADLDTGTLGRWMTGAAVGAA
jgi:ABC-type uncharacterized transport system ATPase subunit